VGVVAPSGATYFRRVRVRGLTAEERAAEERAELTPAFVESVRAAKASPVVEGGAATFVYRGAAKRVELAGDFTGWSPAGLVLRDLPGSSDVKFLTVKFPAGARLEYKLVADGVWMLDPLNPKRNDNGVGGENSNFYMPGYTPTGAGAGQLRGRLEPLAVPGEERRKVQVYLPPGYADSAARYPVLYMQDGTNFIQLGRAAEVADRMITEGKLKPFIIVFVDPIERAKEYWADDRFADWMATGLVPLVDSRYRTEATREARALSGASLGGVISVWTALRHPSVFARVAGHSPAFQIDEERVLAALSRLDEAARRKYPLRFYFDAGRFEPPILEVARRAQLALAARGYAVTYRESPSGHNYTTWRDRLPDAYAALWAD
jgi:enterochelin esterase family protein